MVRIGHPLDKTVIGLKGNTGHVARIQTQNIDTCIHAQMCEYVYVYK